MPRRIFFCALLLLVPTIFPGRTAANECSAATFQNEAALALEACNSVLSKSELSDQMRVEALKIRARSLHRLGFPGPAFSDYELALSLAPNDPELHVECGWTAHDMFELTRAMRLARNALALNPRYAPAFDLIGGVLWRDGNLVTALAAIDEAIAIEPSEPMFRYHRFQLLELRDREREALAEADAILSLSANSLDRPKATSSFGKLVSFRTAANLERALLLSKMGRFEEAEKAFDDLVKSAPSALTFARRASYRMYRTAPLELAQSDVDKALALDPNYWLVHQQMARVHVHARRPHAALASYTRATELNPKHASLRWRRALVLRELGRLDEATSDALDAIGMDRDFLREKSSDLAKRGYLPVPRPSPPLMKAVRDAVRACMLDPECG